MIDIKIFRNKLKYISGFKIEGHAEYGPHGEDIVCAGVSILAQTTLISLFKVLRLTEKQLSYEIKDDGYMEISLNGDFSEEEMKDINIVFRTFEEGIKALIDSYSDYVTLSDGEV